MAQYPEILTAQPEMAERSLTEKLFIAVVVLAALLAMSPSVAEVDLWGHVQYGRDVLEHGLPATTTYSFTAEGYPWINHENLAEIVLAWTADNFGNAGLLVGKSLFALTIIATVLWFNLRSGVGLFTSSAITLLVAANLGFHFSLRPQVASFVCFTWLILIVQLSFSGWRNGWRIWPSARRLEAGSKATIADRISNKEALNYSSQRMRLLWLVPIVFVIWANAHGGFPAGLLVFVAYLGCRGLEAWWTRGVRSLGLLRRFALMAAAAGAATLLTPYSYNLHLWLLPAVGNPCPEISDWCMNELFTITGFKFWLLLVVVVFAVAASRRSWDFTQTVLLALVLWQSILHFRHVPFFALLCGFWIGPHLQSAVDRFVAHRARSGASPAVSSARGMAWFNGGLAVALIALSVSLTNRLTFLHVDKSKFPVDAFQFMSDHEVNGRMVVTYDWAQYAIYVFCTPRNNTRNCGQVSFDGRYRTCYPQELCDYHFDFLFGDGPNVSRFRCPTSAPCEPNRILQLGDPEIVINRRFGERTETVMRQETGKWALLYQDAIAQVWGRRDLFDDPTSPRFIPLDSRKIGNQLSHELVGWPAIPRRTQLAELAATNSNTSLAQNNQ